MSRFVYGVEQCVVERVCLATSARRTEEVLEILLHRPVFIVRDVVRLQRDILAEGSVVALVRAHHAVCGVVLERHVLDVVCELYASVERAAV